MLWICQSSGDPQTSTSHRVRYSFLPVLDKPAGIEEITAHLQDEAETDLVQQ
jgi:hypothetical protein